MNVATSIDTGRAARFLDDWTDLWNGDLAVGPRLLTDDFRVVFGSVAAAEHGTDDLVGGAAVADYIGAFRRRYRHAHFRTELGPLVDTIDGADHLAFRWAADVVDADGTRRTIAGHDILRVRGDRLDRAWSVTGTRDLTPPPTT